MTVDFLLNCWWNSLVHRYCQPRVGTESGGMGLYLQENDDARLFLLRAHLSFSAGVNSWGCWPLVSNSIGPSFLLPLWVAGPLGFHPLSILPMTSHVVILGNSHLQVVSSRFLFSNASKDLPLLSRVGLRCVLCCQSVPQIQMLNSLAQLTLPVEGFLQSGVSILQTFNLI